MARPTTGIYAAYVGPKRGRPKADPPAPTGPTCATCRNMRVDLAKVCECRCGHPLEPAGCPDFKSAAIQRYMVGGTTGIPAR